MGSGLLVEHHGNTNLADELEEERVLSGGRDDHLQSMQSSTQHPNEETKQREQTILVKPINSWINPCLYLPMKYWRIIERLPCHKLDQPRTVTNDTF